MRLPGLFVVGTDTGVGKTRVAAAIAHWLTRSGRRVGVLKPICTGATREGDLWRSSDSDVLINAIGGGIPVDRVTARLFEAPVAPPVAARAVGQRLTLSDVATDVMALLDWWQSRAEVIIMEGIGGLLCPLAEDATVADLAVALDYPLVIVARRALGTLNHTLLTVEAARSRGLRIAGIVCNAAEPSGHSMAENTNIEELSRRVDRVAVLADLEHREDPETLWAGVRDVDWYGWARSPRLIARPDRPDFGD
jgi:dethiobiotin synthetase